MKRWIFVLTAFLMAAAGFGPAAGADELTVSVPQTTKFVLRLDIQAFRATALGGKLVEIARKEVEHELSDGATPGRGPNLEKIILEMLGFDPFAEIQSIVVSGSDYDRPEQSIVVSIRMKKSTGNLEGLILGLPGYKAEDYGKFTIYSATPENDVRVFGSIHTDTKGDKTILLAAQREAVVHLLDSLDGKPAGDGSVKTIKLESEGKPILTLDVLKVPTDMKLDGPLAGAVKVIRVVSLRISESKGDVNIGVSLVAGTEQKAEQLRQMAQGLIAMIDLEQSANPDDEDLKTFQKFAHNIKAARDGLSMKVSLSVSAEELNEIIDKQLRDQ